eukprot:919788-Amorphochlora_amoeboformis.AAC.3
MQILRVNIDYGRDIIRCGRIRAEVPMLKIGEWKAHSSVNHIDFDHQDFPTPAQYQYPGMNIRQIAEELEQTKEEVI